MPLALAPDRNGRPGKLRFDVTQDGDLSVTQSPHVTCPGMLSLDPWTMRGAEGLEPRSPLSPPGRGLGSPT